MGVGVYSSNFNGSGSTFLVDGPLEGNQDDYDDFNERLIESVEQVGHELGLDIEKRRGFTSDRSTFDDDFVNILNTDFHQVGWRSWEHDFVIGVGIKSQYMNYFESPDEYAAEIISSSGRAPSVFIDLCSKYAEALGDYVRMSMQDDGFDASYKTSGYTTSQYKLPDNAKEEIQRLKTTLTDLASEMKKSAVDALKEQGPDERTATMRAIFNAESPQDMGNAISIHIPVYSHPQNLVMLVDPISNEVAGYVSARYDDEGIDFAKIMADAPQVEGLSVIPRNEDTSAWFDYRQNYVSPANRDALRLVASADEYCAAVSEDLVIQHDGLIFEVQHLLNSSEALVKHDDPEFRDSIRSKCDNILRHLESADDDRVDVFRKGVQATRDLTGGSVSSDELKNKMELIHAALNEKYRDDYEVTFTHKPKPTMKP